MLTYFSWLVVGAAVIAEIVFVVYAIYGGKSAAPFLPSTRRTTRRMVAAAGIQPGEIVYDLGSGDGRILFAAAREGAVATGIEIHPMLVWWSRFWAWVLRHKVTVIRDNLWNTDIRSADVIFLFILHTKMPALEQKIRREAKPGARIVSNSFTFPGWQYEKKDGTVYVYRVPESPASLV